MWLCPIEPLTVLLCAADLALTLCVFRWTSGPEITSTRGGGACEKVAETKRKHTRVRGTCGIFAATFEGHLVPFPGEKTASAVDVDAAVIHDSYHVAALRAHCRCGDAVVMGTKTEEQPVRVDVYEAHQAVLTQHAEDLHGVLILVINIRQ